MKVLSLLCLGLVALAAATPLVDLDNKGTLSIKDKQIFILKLLNNVLQNVMYKDIQDIGRNYKLEDNIDHYYKTDVVKDVVNMMKTGILPRGEVFTLHIDRQLKEVVRFFHLLYYAKDFTTFLKTACWMRLYVNEGMFVYALTVAVRHRDDCRGIILPPPYEIYPYYFVRADVIQKAYLLKMKRGLLDNQLCDFYGIKKNDKDVYVIDENVYDTRVNLNTEDRLRYFTEDIDLNTYYYHFHVDYPFWMSEDILEKTKSRRWEVTLYMYQQLLARYYLERLSNDMDDIKTLTWNKRIQKGYWPWLKLHNGVELPVRFNDHLVVRDYNVNVMNLVEEYESIIKESIIKGYVEIDGQRLTMTKPEDIENLGQIIYGKVDFKNVDKKRVDAYRYLLILMKSVLGLNTVTSDKYFVVPSILDQYQTALRDPVFYQLQKRLINYVMLFKKHLPSYTKEDLLFPGVKIDNVLVDKLVTYFDDFLMDMTNAVTFTEEELKKTKSDMFFMVRKRRLNNQPFKVTLDVLSDKTVDCHIKMFLGPREDRYGNIIDINKNRQNFVEIDSFIYKLDTGKNTIVRKSIDMHNIITDRILMYDFMRKLDTTDDIKNLFMKDFSYFNTGFPVRLLLPKGRVGGLKMFLYVFIAPVRFPDNIDRNIIDTKGMDCTNCRFTTVIDKTPLGYPLDRDIDLTKFVTPNMKFVDVVVFHKLTTCDMKMRWQRYVLKNYNFTDKLPNDGTFFVDTEIDTNMRNKNLDYDMNL